MSKKMLKRSLALGALMAFVITGSAMAREIEATNMHGLGNKSGEFQEIAESEVMNEDVLDINIIDTKDSRTYVGVLVYGFDKGQKLNNNKVYYEDGTLTINANSISITGTAASALHTNHNESDLILNVAEKLYIDSIGHGINTGTGVSNRIIINGANAVVDIIAGENAVVVRGGDRGSVEITGKKVTLESTNTGEQAAAKGHAIYAQGENGNIVINATESLSVTAVAGKRAVSAVANGTDISLDGGKETIINGSIYADGEGNNKTDEMNITVKGTNITIDAEGNNRAVEVWSDYPNSTTNDQIGVYIGDENTQKIDIKNFGVEQGDGKNKTAAGLYVVYDGSFVDIKAKELNIISDKEIGTGSDDKPRAVLGIYVASGTASTYRPESDSGDDARVVISEDTVTTIDVKDVAISALSEAKVDIKGDLFATAESVITARGGSSVVINKSGKKTVQLNGDIYFDYDEPTSGTGIDATIDITLKGEDSWLKGSVTADGEAPEDKASVAGMKLGLFDGATWTVTDDSFMNTLVGTDGTVVLTTDIENKALANVEIGSNQNANLTVSGDEKLTKAIEDGTVTDVNAALKALNEAVTISDTANSKKIATVKTAEGKILGSYVLTENGAELQESSKSAAVSEAGMNLKAHWRAHMNDMNKRMGDLRMANGETGVWTRMVRGETEYEGAKMQYNQYQLGYDEKLSVDKRWTVGAAVTFAEGDSSYGQGSSEDKSTAFAIYGSKLNNDGTFVDLIARYARLESDIEDSVYEKGEYDTNGMSVSAEFGKRIQQGKGLWIEPQVELTYGTVDSATVKFADGSVANYGDMDSLIGRVGFRLGKDIERGNVYARASYLYDFDGESETAFSNGTVSGKPIEEDFGGGWWEVGVGANINLSKATYIYADVEKTFGGEVDTNWQWNLGVRYSF
ncbi:MAG: autotransporter outer membrane beta-barrel domain-containing protein [Phascolarctobacterium sp.]|nr:autotransporter outer membrane beta-barrel domain-containing protein [Phascolarctobacterium sp.]